MENAIQDRIINATSMMADQMGAAVNIEDPAQRKQAVDMIYGSEIAKIVDPNKEQYDFFANDPNASQSVEALAGISAVTKRQMDRQQQIIEIQKNLTQLENIRNQKQGREDKLKIDALKTQAYIDRTKSSAKIADKQRADNQKQINVTQSNKLRSEFNPYVKEYSEFDTKMNQIDSLSEKIKAEGNLSGADVYALFMNVGKLLDPQSVFREGEFATLAKSGDAYQGLMKELQGLQGDQRMATPEMVDNLFGLVQTLRGAVVDAFAAATDRYGKLSDQYGVDPSLVLGDRLANMYLGDDEDIIEQEMLETQAQPQQQPSQDRVAKLNSYLSLYGGAN